MKKIQLYLLLSVVVFATGCPNEPSKDLNKKNSLVDNINTRLADYQTKYDAAFKDDPVEAKRQRDDAIEFVLAIIDDKYMDFINKIETRRSRADFVADVIELGTGAAIGITKGERPNQILGIALTAFRGGRRSSELNFYKQQTTPILIAKMDDNRAQIYAGILKKMRTGVKEYSMRAAIRDMVAYYNAGTLVRAFTQLSKDTAAQAKQSEDTVRVLKGENVTVSDIPTVEHERISDRITAQRISLAKQLQDANSVADATEKAKKVSAVRLKYDTIWKDIEAQDKFAPFINEMKTDPDLTAIFAKLPDKRAELKAEDFDTLLTAFNSKITAKAKADKNTELEELFTQILERDNK